MALFRRKSKNKGKEIDDGPRNFKWDEILSITDGLTNQLGEGMFGKVYKGKYKGADVPVKVGEDTRGKNLRGSWTPSLTSISSPVFGRSQHLDSLATALTWSETLKVLKGVAAMLEYIHTRRIVYNDLKPENVLLDEDCSVKIGDFGAALEENEYVQIYTPGYEAPELRKAKPSFDIYSFGIVALQLIMKADSVKSLEDSRRGRSGGTKTILEHKRELQKNGQPVVHRRLLGSGCDSKITKKLLEIVDKCTIRDPTARPSIREVLVHLENL
ncbi:hypothetical protein V6N12_074551 [Hibiscus sabdariffa]|uniref:Protein kinase domain-containing protein n=1 Tax=Hibiscus sabdariffa TaxID=183260 RepID=A0ABR2AAC7_9ROSI